MTTQRRYERATRSLDRDRAPRRVREATTATPNTGPRPHPTRPPAQRDPATADRGIVNG